MVLCILAFVIVVHGLIHFMGFAKAFGYGNITQFTKTISRSIGALWLFGGMLLIITAVLFLLKNEYWWIAAFSACGLSQVLILSVWRDAKFGTVANILIAGYALFQMLSH